MPMNVSTSKIQDTCIQYFSFLSKQLLNLINTHIKYTLSVPAFGTKAVEYNRLYMITLPPKRFRCLLHQRFTINEK